MKKITIFFTGTILLAAILAVTAFKPHSNGPSANGQGGLLLNGRVQHFSFHANTDASGDVSGTWESKSPGQECRQHGEITCMSILPDGKTAILSGVITNTDGVCFGSSVGTPISFEVQDNGEGARSADLFSDYLIFADGCYDHGFFLQPITNGNIQVKP
jgi:hypothetical protein